MDSEYLEASADSISLSLSKGSVNEEMSMFRASMEDAAGRLADGMRPEAISNEKIQKGGKILETYQVTSDAIHGGMGSVWRVHHMNWNVDLAMKRPQPKYFAEAGERRKEEFIAECENWINLGLHPNIVSCYYIRDISGVPSIFSEWMDGGSLKDCIRNGSVYTGSRPETIERLLDIAIRFANGLQYAHEAGLLHQDVKPDNLLLNKDREAKVADFGLARARARFADVKAEDELVLRNDRNGVRDVAVSPNGRFAAIVPDNGSVLLYEMNWKYKMTEKKKTILGRLFHGLSGRRGKG